MNDRKRDGVSREFASRLHISAAGVNDPVLHLSGGNQQKVVLAKWLLLDPQILIVDEPTRGIDVAAKAEVHRFISDLAHREGKAVILISSDLTEVLSLSDRILVMHEGRITGELDGESATEEAVMRYASIKTE
jgi:ABC-type sugar transport system ATPase subunit